MALTSITKDFVVKAGALVEGTRFASSSTGQTGTLQVNGGAAIAKNLVVGTTATIWGDSSLIGSLNVTGPSTVNSLTATTFTATSANILGNLTVSGASALQGILTVTGNSLFNGAVNTFSGALFVTGTNILTVGTGATTLGGTLTADGKTLLNNTTAAIVAGGGDGALKVLGGAYVGNNLIVASTASNTATVAGNALYVAGGTYVDRELTVNGPALFRDTVTFTGTATFVLSTNTFYTDNILELHTHPGGVYGAWTLDDGLDIGFRFHYYAGGTDKNAGLVLDNTSKELHWYENGSESGSFSTGTYGTFRTANIRLTGTADASSTITGAFQVVGGAGIGGKLYASQLAGRNLTTASGIVYSLSDGTLQNTPITFDSAAQRLVGVITTASTAINLAGGAAGSLSYQSGASTTQMLPIGTNGQILVVSGGNPTWSAPTGLTAGSATTSSNIAGGLTNQIPYQSAPGQTQFNVGLTYNGSQFTTTNIVVSSGNNATAATGNSGALMVRGGVGIQNDLWVGGNINLAGNLFLDGVGLDTIQGTTGTFVNILVTGTNATNSAATGALQVTGGVGIGGGLFVGGVITGTTVNVTGVATVNILAVTGFSSLSGGATISAATVTNNLLVSGNETVTGFTSLNGGATISAATVTNTLAVTGFSSLNGGATISAATVTTTLAVTGYTSLNGGSTLNATTVTGSATVGTTLGVTGYTTLSGGATISAATVTNNLLVSGNETITGFTSMNGGATASALTVTNALTVGTTLGVTGFTSLNGGATISAATVTNALAVTGFSSLNGGATISAATVTNALTVGTTLGVTGRSTLGDAVISAATVTNALTVGTTLGVTGRTTLGLLTATITTVTALTVIGNETVGGTLNVTGRTTLADAVITTVTATNLVVTGTASLPSNVNLSSLTVTNLTVTGNETVGGNLQVTGLFTATNTANFAGLVRFTNATDSNATNVGAVVVTGGVGIAKNLTVGTGVTVGTASTQTVVPSVFSNNVLYSSYTSQFIVTNALINLDTFSAAAYRSAKYFVQIVDGTKIQVEEIVLFHDGTNVYMTEYASMNNTGNLGDFDAVLNAGTITLNFTANYSPTSMTIKVVRTAITV